MDSEKRRYLKITSIFVALEAVFSYYLVGLLLIGYRPGHLLLGWSNGKVNLIFSNPLNYLPGLGYVLKTYFPIYWMYVFRGPTEIPLLSNEISQIYAALNFLSLFWIGLTFAVVVTAILYSQKIKLKIISGGTSIFMGFLSMWFGIYSVMGYGGVYFRWSFFYLRVDFSGISLVNTYEVLMPYLLIGLVLSSAGIYLLISKSRNRWITYIQHSV